jgi:prepilin-type N-terminal cleavage/methylation domain-containing protein
MIVARLCSNFGMTLIEQLISLLIGSVLITALYGYFRAELYRLLVLETKTATLEDARGALDIMIRDLKNAGSWGTGSAPVEVGGADDPNNDADTVCNRVYAASASLIHVQMDLNGNGNCADNDPRENIRYELTGPTSTCAGPGIIRRNGDCLVANVVPTTAGKVFSYYDANGVDLGNTPPPHAIKRVKISFAIRVKNPDPKVTDNLASVLTSSVEFRN